MVEEQIQMHQKLLELSAYHQLQHECSKKRAVRKTYSHMNEVILFYSITWALWVLLVFININ